MDSTEQALFNLFELAENIGRMHRKERDDWETDLQPSEIHVIAFLSENSGSNLSVIASAVGITRGGASKILKRLEKKNMIAAFQRPGNRKEIYFELTGEGGRICEKHLEIHRKWKNRDLKVLNRLGRNEIFQLSRLTRELNQLVEDEILEMGRG